jgi:hypothetical protein
LEYHEPGFLVRLDAEQRVRYYDWWQNYLLWRRAAQVVTAIAFASALASSILWKMLLPRQMLLFQIAAAIRKPVFWVAFAFAIWGSLLDCPRCGQSFRGWFGRRYFGGECQNCGLSYRDLSSIGRPRP